jgi:hypothetical protein
VFVDVNWLSSRSGEFVDSSERGGGGINIVSWDSFCEEFELGGGGAKGGGSLLADGDGEADMVCAVLVRSYYCGDVCWIRG